MREGEKGVLEDTLQIDVAFPLKGLRVWAHWKKKFDEKKFRKHRTHASVDHHLLCDGANVYNK